MKVNILIILFTISAISLKAQPEKLIRKGNHQYNDGNYQQAEVEYRKALDKDPDGKKADYNLGNALYKQKQYDAAASKYAELAKSDTDKERLNRYYYNLGNTLFQSQKYGESIEAYKQALKNKPSDMDAKHNLQMALRRLHEQEQQQNQNQNNNQNNQQQNKDNQNSKDNQDKQNDSQNNQPDNSQQNDPGTDQPQPKEGQISQEDAERILQALENEEKQVIKKVQDRKEKTRKVPVEKNW